MQKNLSQHTGTTPMTDGIASLCIAGSISLGCVSISLFFCWRFRPPTPPLLWSDIRKVLLHFFCMLSLQCGEVRVQKRCAFRFIHLLQISEQIFLIQQPMKDSWAEPCYILLVFYSLPDMSLSFLSLSSVVWYKTLQGVLDLYFLLSVDFMFSKSCAGLNNVDTETRSNWRGMGTRWAFYHIT